MLELKVWRCKSLVVIMGWQRLLMANASPFALIMPQGNHKLNGLY